MPVSSDFDRVEKALNRFLEESLAGERPVISVRPLGELLEELRVDELISHGGLTDERLDEFLQTYLGAASRMQHPGMMGHQVGCPHPGGVLGGFIDAFTNNPMNIYEMGASAAALEFAVINWMLKKVGWFPVPLPGESRGTDHFGAGVLTHGGSLAQLTALATARSYADCTVWEQGNNPDLVVVAPKESHYSVSRALGLMGMGQQALRLAPCDRQGRMEPKGLRRLLHRLENDGSEVMAVVANACNTAAGLYDPLDEIGEICNSEQVWLHVDGAHGASALLSRSHRQRLKGIERANSLIWDAHKMMRTPGLCAAVLVKDHRTLEHSFAQQASYLLHDKDQPGIDFISRTVECTKAGLGLRFFMVLASEGEAALGEYVTGRYDFATQVADLITTHPRLELAVAPQANIVCFRVKDIDDKGQLELRRQLIGDAQSYVTTTLYAGRRWLRFTFMNPDTGLLDVQKAIDSLLQHAETLPADKRTEPTKGNGDAGSPSSRDD